MYNHHIASLEIDTTYMYIRYTSGIGTSTAEINVTLTGFTGTFAHISSHY
jgi:hypothetical protein